MNRYECLERLVGWVGDDAIVATSLSSNTAIWSKLRGDGPNFFGLNLGLCIAFATGVSMAFPQRTVLALDSDGSAMVDTSALITLADAAPTNFVGIVMDNESYARMGRTATSRRTDVAAMAQGAGVPVTGTIRTLDELDALVRPALAGPGPSLFVVKVEAEFVRIPTSGIPTSGPAMKDRFVQAVKKLPDYQGWRNGA